jgi:glycosyltransferase involved in cell wall biosynthesis
MVQRKRLGLVFSYNDRWIGGTYYTINLIQALKVLPEYKQPEIVIFSNAIDYSRLEQETNYPYLTFEMLDERPLPKWKRQINYILETLTGRKNFNRTYKGLLDSLFLIQHCGYLDSVPIERRIYWVPDLQDKHLPQFFTVEGLKSKDKKCKWIAQNAHHLILSSNAVLTDWKTFYPESRCKVKVVHFAVTHSPYQHLNIDELRSRYNLPEVYFFSPNQFWAHKNHMVVIKAAEQLKREGTPVVIAFSGKENDNRNPGYTESLKAYVQEHHLEDVIRFLGFLDRAEQLQIMKYARAVIQPSRFEGWSTVIEDAMAMNQPVIASDLGVNKEQLGVYGWYFDAVDQDTLVKQIQFLANNLKPINYNYETKIVDYAETFIKIFDEMNFSDT